MKPEDVSQEDALAELGRLKKLFAAAEELLWDLKVADIEIVKQLRLMLTNRERRPDTTPIISTTWGLLAYIVEYRESIFVRHEGRRFALAELGRTLAAAWVIEFMEKWGKSGFVPPRGLPEPAVHHLHHGYTACVEVTPVLRCFPGEWPPGHKWSTNWREVTCNECLIHAPGRP